MDDLSIFGILVLVYISAVLFMVYVPSNIELELDFSLKVSITYMFSLHASFSYFNVVVESIYISKHYV